MKNTAMRAAVAGFAAIAAVVSVAPPSMAADDAAQTVSITVALDSSGDAYFPPGATANGSTVQITIQPATGGPTQQTCRATEPGADGSASCPPVTIPAGASATISQTVGTTGVGVSPQVRSIAPTTAPDASTDVVLTAPGRAPTVSDTTDSNVITTAPTDIDVLFDDVIHDPTTTLQILTQSQHGTAEVVQATDRGWPIIRFTPQDPYHDGLAEFTYAATNRNGTTSPVTVSLLLNAPNPDAPWGEQHFGVYVQLDPGSWFPEGTTVLGSTFAITYTDPDGVVLADLECTATVLVTASFPRCPEGFVAPPRASVRVVQTSAPEGIDLDPRVVELPPCELGIGLGATFCLPDEDPLFTLRGPRPETNPDDVSTEMDQEVDADVLDNDPVGDPDVSLAIETAPIYGTAQVIGRATSTVSRSSTSLPSSPLGLAAQATPAASIAHGDQVIRYTPDAGFTGVDVVRIRVTNSNASSVETLRVTVRDGAVAGDDQLLPDTGGPDARWLALGALLTAAGGVVVTRRRRSDVR